MNLDEMTYAIRRLDELTRHLSNQINKPKTNLDIIKEYAGIVSLVLALTISAFSLWDNIHSKPLSVALTNKVQFQNTLKSMLEVEVKLSEARLNGSATDIIDTLMSQESFLLKQAEDRIAADPEISSFAEEKALGLAYLREAKYEQRDEQSQQAIRHIKKAVRLSKNPVDTIETQLDLVESLVFAGKQEEARTSLREAEDLAKGDDKRVELAQIYGHGAWLECYFNHPDSGEKWKREAKKLFEELITDPAPQNDNYANYISTERFKFVESLEGTKCYNQREELEANAANDLGLLFGHDLGEFKGRLNRDLSSKWSMSSLNEYFEKIVDHFGVFQRILRVESQNRSADVYCKMQGGKLVMHLRFDHDMRLNDFNVPLQVIE